MTNTLIEKSIDIYQLPTESLPGSDSITIGDMHGNAIKFINFLFNHNIVRFKDSADAFTNYKRLGEIYDEIGEHVNQLLTADEVEAANLNIKISRLHRIFLDIFNELEIVDNTKLLRLLGDLLAERGSSSTLILKIYELAFQYNQNLTTMMSDHDLEFLFAYYNLKRGYAFENPYPGIDPAYKISLLGLKALLETNDINPQDLINSVDESYIPTLKLIDCTFTEDGGIRIFSHAPVKFKIIQYMANKLNITYKDDTIYHVADVINKINLKFQDCLANGRLEEFFPPLIDNNQGLIAAKLNDHQNLDSRTLMQRLFPTLNQDRLIKKFPFWYLVWNRFETAQDTLENRPHEYKDYLIYYVHGHDPFQSQLRFVLNADTQGGKIAKYSQFQILEESQQKLNEVTQELQSAVDKFNQAQTDNEKLKLKKQIKSLERSIKQGTSFIAEGFYNSLKEYKVIISDEKGLTYTQQAHAGTLRLSNWNQDIARITRSAAFGFSLSFMLGFSAREAGLMFSDGTNNFFASMIQNAYMGGVASLCAATATFTASFGRRVLSYLRNRDSVTEYLIANTDLPAIENSTREIAQIDDIDLDEEIDDRPILKRKVMPTRTSSHTFFENANARIQNVSTQQDQRLSDPQPSQRLNP